MFSVVASALGVTEKEPVPLVPVVVIVTVPLLVSKSPALDTAQFNTVPFVTLVVVTVNVIPTPSLTDVTPTGGVTA